ncbi:MAG: hypothetical protein JWQ87_3886 [Candidatus Sulfotelmatobacter sp.]|nr:hypothetical protein [Candidatus Sulfotelmatobacter sp.]
MVGRTPSAREVSAARLRSNGVLRNRDFQSHCPTHVPVLRVPDLADTANDINRYRSGIRDDISPAREASLLTGLDH